MRYTSVRIPSKYREGFLEIITAENLLRIVIGLAIITLIETGVLLTGHFQQRSTLYFPPAAILFNALVIPAVLYLRRREGMLGRKRLVIYLVVFFYIVWAGIFNWAGRFAHPMSDPGISLYILVVYGAAVFVYMEPQWSAVLFSTGLATFLLLVSRASYAGYSVTGHLWNASALSAIAWITSRFLFSFRLNTHVARTELEYARAVSDALLLNILPEKIVHELKEKGVSSPERFDRVTVLFSDLVDFTEISSHMDPEALIAELNDIFAEFDSIAGKYSCQRIKTIGDAYLCVCGMPEENPRQAELILKVSMDMVEYLKERNKTSSNKWQVRIGIHAGSVVGGIVGTGKYIYDVFGDTINIAHRMEQHSAPMRINVSRVVKCLEEDKFAFTDRGTVEVKGLGELSMYYLDACYDQN